RRPEPRQPGLLRRQRCHQHRPVRRRAGPTRRRGVIATTRTAFRLLPLPSTLPGRPAGRGGAETPPGRVARRDTGGPRNEGEVVMMRAYLLAALAGLGLVGLSAAQNARLSDLDQKFVNTAAVAGMAEVKAGEVAKDRATSDDVKKFADSMVADHS